MNEKEKNKIKLKFEKKLDAGVYQGKTWEMLSKDDQYTLALIQTNFDEEMSLFMVNIESLPVMDGDQIIIYK